MLVHVGIASYPAIHELLESEREGESSNDLSIVERTGESILMGLGLVEGFLDFLPFVSFGFRFLVWMVSLQRDLGLGTCKLKSKQEPIK